MKTIDTRGVEQEILCTGVAMRQYHNPGDRLWVPDPYNTRIGGHWLPPLWRDGPKPGVRCFCMVPPPLPPLPITIAQKMPLAQQPHHQWQQIVPLTQQPHHQWQQIVPLAHQSQQQQWHQPPPPPPRYSERSSQPPPPPPRSEGSGRGSAQATKRGPPSSEGSDRQEHQRMKLAIRQQ